MAESTDEKKKPKKTLPIIFGIIIISGTVYGIIKYIYALHHEVTDDAQIENDISPVIARVAGYVSKINFEENQPVSKGDTLIILDDHDLKIKVRQAEASLQMASAGINVVDANVATAKAAKQTAVAGVESAQVKARKASQDYSHYENLVKETAVSQQQFENSKADKDNAAALLNAALGTQTAEDAKIEAAKKQIPVAESFVAQKRADLDYAKLQLSYAYIIAPTSGFASRKNVQPGQYVNAGSPLFAIVSDSGAYIIANFKETQLTNMKKGQPVEIMVDAFPDTTLAGHVYAFSPATGAKFSLLPPDNATGNFVKVVQRIPVKILIDGGKAIKNKLIAGMSVKVAVKTD